MNPHLEQLQQTKRLVLISTISMVVLFWFGMFDQPVTKKPIEATQKEDLQIIESGKIEIETKKEKFETVNEALNDIKNSGKYIQFETQDISGSINLVGAKIDNLTLLNYTAENDKSKKINFLTPQLAPDYHYIDFGWISPENGIKTPNSKTIWSAKKETEVIAGNPNKSINLQTIIDGNIFEIKLILHDKFLWKVKMSAIDRNKNNLKVKPYVRIKKSINTKTGTSYSHEGVSLVNNGILEEIKYSDIEKNLIKKKSSQNGWIGIGEKYWFSGIIVPNEDGNETYSYQKTDCEKCYQVDVINSSLENEFNFLLYTGAKEFETIKKYQNEYNIKLFDRVIDFGWFYFLTKPILVFLKFLYAICGNFGVAIILLTVLIRALMFPLAQKSFRSMAKMKSVSPKMQELKEKHKDDKTAFNKALVELYKLEKVNPAAGCFPILLQIPVFFALYKVLIVSIEMRDASFLLWITDLSDPDPTSLFNLFGLIPYAVPKFLNIGILPLIMGFSMWLQQKFSPQPADPNQAKMMKFLPIIFTFMFAGFPSGLVLYWTTNNILSIVQQWLVSREVKK